MADKPKEKPDLLLSKLVNSHDEINDPRVGGRTSHNRKPMREDYREEEIIDSFEMGKPNMNYGQKRVPKDKSEYRDPSTSTTFDEQVLFIASDLAQRIEKGNSISATAFTYEWIDGIVDGHGTIYGPVRDELMSLDKSNLIDYLGYILGSIR